MKAKKEKTSNYETVMSALVVIVGEVYDAGKLEHYECIGVFDSAKQLFIDIQNRKREEQNED
jgi:hypothetical protein